MESKEISAIHLEMTDCEDRLVHVMEGYEFVAEILEQANHPVEARVLRQDYLTFAQRLLLMTRSLHAYCTQPAHELAATH